MTTVSESGAAADPDEPPPSSGPMSARPRVIERVRMVRLELSQLAEFPLPEGFTLRDYRPGDRGRWLELVQATERHLPITTDHHTRAFGEDEAVLTRRQLFLLAPDGRVIGTATAWLGSDPFSADWGRVHWLAILPVWQGRGLAKPLLAATLRRLRDLGHQRAYLITENIRPLAIALYLRFGFRPEIRTEADAAAWEAVPASIRVPR